MTAAPLAGWRVLNPRPLPQAERWTAAFSAAGATVLSHPFMAYEDVPLTPESAAWVAHLDQFDGVLLASQAASVRALALLQDRWPQWPLGVTVLAVGDAAAAPWRAAGWSVTVPDQADSEGLLALPALAPERVAGQRWLLCRGTEGRPLLPTVLQARDARLAIWSLYRRTWPTEPIPREAATADVVLLTSTQIWHHWQQWAGEHAVRPWLMVGHARLAEQVIAAGAQHLIQADGPYLNEWLQALTHWSATQHRNLSHGT